MTPAPRRIPPQVANLEEHAELRAVLTEAQSQGFVSSGDLARPIAHAAGFASVPDSPPDRYMDLGSGGGLPGLVLALIWPDAAAVLLDAGERRADFLTWATEQLTLTDRVAVRRARAEAAAHDPGLRGAFDVVTARGFAPPAVTAECAAPMLRPGGQLVVSEPPADPEDAGPDRWPSEGLAEVGLKLGPTVTEPFHYQALTQETPCPPRYPRRIGVPAKRPLF